MQPSSAAKVVPQIFRTLLLASAVFSAPAHAQTFTVLHTFTGAPNDGEGPFGQLIRDSAGNLYGTTTAGGVGKCGNYGGCGTAFMLNKAGKEIAKFSFNGRNGFSLLAGLLRDAAGNFYGTTVFGGDKTCEPPYGCGTVFKISKTGKETVLHKFTGTPDGWSPEALLVEDAAGNLYGTTYEGGAFDNAGTVFKVDKEGNESILYNFCSEANCADGNSPYPSVILDTAGNLYGVAGGGIYGAGVVYELDGTGKETVLYSFTGFSDGGGPAAVLLADANGNLYGTTQGGGNLACGGGDGCGVVFKLSPHSGGSWTESTLYTFCTLLSCADGEEPIAGPLVRDTAGNLYGNTYFGGASRCNGAGCGVVFKLDATGKETVLHSFTGGADGGFPWAGLTMDSAGNLYGVATGGGDTACSPPSGCGVVFKLTP
ncbi:MAG: choice-of-anchor tandem repeat GloVer-containing protein [Terriglobales bacterium]|jgi:uncharacterized repeat protein (TIGR03803 family)